MKIRWPTLIQNIRDGACVPFIGSAACASRLPMSEELAAELLKRSTVPGPYPFKSDSLAKVAQYVAALSGDAVATKRIVENVIHERSVAPGDPIPRIHRMLARLRLPIYITTNYDLLLEEALRFVRVDPVTEICRWSQQLLDHRPSGFDSGEYRPKKETPVVFHLHGAVGVDPDSLVVTEDDYLDFLVNMSREFSTSPRTRNQPVGLPLPLRTAIASQPLLFIGYSLTDVDFLFILRSLMNQLEPHRRVQRVAVQLDPEPLPEGDDMESYRERVEQYFAWTYHGVGVLWEDIDALCNRLEREFPSD
jgi:SIR2-like domain